MNASLSRSALFNAALSNAALLLAAAALTSAPVSAQVPSPVTDAAPSATPSGPPKPLAPAPSTPAPLPADKALQPEGGPAASPIASEPGPVSDAAVSAPQPAAPGLAPTPASAEPAPTAAEPARAAAQPASDPSVDNPLVEDPPPSRAAPDTPRLDAWLGVHGLIVFSPGFDAFSEDDGLTSFGAGVGAELGAVGGGRLAAVVGISVGGDEESYRGQDAELSVVRLTLGPELRFPFGGRFFGYGRLSPELVHFTAELGDDSSTTTLEQGKWLFGVDTALGVALRVADLRPQGMTDPLSIFLRFEAGYTWSPETELALSPEGSDGPIRSEPLSLGELSLSGVSFRGALGLGY